MPLQHRRLVAGHRDIMTTYSDLQERLDQCERALVLDPGPRTQSIGAGCEMVSNTPRCRRPAPSGNPWCHNAVSRQGPAAAQRCSLACISATRGTRQTHRGLRRQGTAIRRCVLRHCSRLPFSVPLPPFPHVRGLSRLGVLRRLRPALDRSAIGVPSPRRRAGRATAGGTRTVPVFTVIRSTKEERGSVPAASPRLLRSTSP